MIRWFLILGMVLATINQRKPCIDNCLNDDIITENIIVNCLQLKCREIIQNITKYQPAIKVYVEEHDVYNDLNDHMEAYMHKKHMMQRINEYGELKLKTMTQDVIDSYLVYTNILTQVYKLLDSLMTIESVEEEQKAFNDMEDILNNSTEYMPGIQNAVQILNAELVRIAASVNQTFFLFQTMMNRRISIMLLRKHMYNVSNEIRNHMVHYKPLTIQPYQNLNNLAHLDWSVDISDDLLDPSNIAESRLCPMCPTCPTCPTCPACPSFICPQCPMCPTCPICPICPICQQQVECIHHNNESTPNTVHHTNKSNNNDALLFGGVGILIGLLIGALVGYFIGHQHNHKHHHKHTENIFNCCSKNNKGRSFRKRDCVSYHD